MIREECRASFPAENSLPAEIEGDSLLPFRYTPPAPDFDEVPMTALLQLAAEFEPDSAARAGDETVLH